MAGKRGSISPAGSKFIARKPLAVKVLEKLISASSPSYVLPGLLRPLAT